jgi:hypothetical protein
MAKRKSKSNNTLLWVGGGIAAYFLFFKPKTTANTAVTVVPSSVPGLPAQPTTAPGAVPSSSLLSSLTNLIPGVTNLLGGGSAPNPANQIIPDNTTAQSVQTITPAPVITTPQALPVVPVQNSSDNSLEQQMYQAYQNNIMNQSNFSTSLSGVGCGVGRSRIEGFMKDHYYSR